ncbi:81a98d33-45fb-4d23-a689-0c97f217ac22 [Sclerotinia trifoliorum]|uniref:81a98d33-45fb-4d23-a689-0c97f217ac22 n=1 Tax=Sclerotinia trifoliorum TaxID=28548 RepID=A0A8H2W3C0_9HELO|nr:81a98d33-45fb-4d23-a689-0c97f217ac22 [Sclerotinia trifoliorum]
MASYLPPPAYSEIYEPPRLRDGAQPSQIRRKPLTPRLTTATSSESDINTPTKHGQDIQGNGKTERHDHINHTPASVSKSQADSLKIANFKTLQITQTSTNIQRTISTPATPLNFSSSENLSKITLKTSPEPSSTAIASSYITSAYREARHFAGGLIAHPSESTKHYSILRHSHGLVFYQGSSTTLAISIFSDAPLPTGRQIWLQNKGWTGNTGMRLKAFVGSNSNWVNVTPGLSISAAQLKESDERAWQRDIKKFLRKTKYPNHLLRETLIIRIPVEASDGYFHLVLCSDEKKRVICPSPVFRILSASTSPASVRGASLSTLPLELGAMAMTAYANKTIGRLITPATSAAEKIVHPFMPSPARKEAARTFYGKSGTGDMIKSTVLDGNIRYEGMKSFSYNQAGSGDNEFGPKPPYPISFAARSEIQIREDEEEEDYFSMPSMKLSGIADHISHQLRGHYFAWARQHPIKGQANTDANQWSQSVISSLPPQASDLHKATIKQVNKRILKIHFISEFFEARNYDAKNLDIKIMGFIRSDSNTSHLYNHSQYHSDNNDTVRVEEEEELIASMNDILFTRQILKDPIFAPEMHVNIDVDVKERVVEGYAELRVRTQRGVDGVLGERMGMRGEGDRLRDMGVGVGGFFVVR